MTRQEERWLSRSPQRPRRHSHLPRHRFYPRHVLLELNISGLGSRQSRLAPKPLARTKVNVSHNAFLGQSFGCPSMQFRTHALWDIPDAFSLRLIACESAACFVHVHHCAMRRSVSSVFTFARRRLCFVLGSLVVLLGSIFLCVHCFFFATKNDSARLAAFSCRQCPCVLKILLQMATSFAVWRVTVPARSSWSLRDFVISFFAMVQQSSFACLGQGHTPHVEFSRSQFSLLPASPLMSLCQDKRKCGSASRGYDTLGCT